MNWQMEIRETQLTTTYTARKLDLCVTDSYLSERDKKIVGLRIAGWQKGLKMMLKEVGVRFLNSQFHVTSYRYG